MFPTELQKINRHFQSCMVEGCWVVTAMRASHFGNLENSFSRSEIEKILKPKEKGECKLQEKNSWNTFLVKIIYYILEGKK